MCCDKIQVLNRCISCKYYAKDGAIITHLQFIPTVPRLRPNEHQVADIPLVRRHGVLNPEPAMKKSKILNLQPLRKEPPRFLRMENRIRIEYTLHHLQVIGPTYAMKSTTSPMDNGT